MVVCHVDIADKKAEIQRGRENDKKAEYHFLQVHLFPYALNCPKVRESRCR